MAFRVVLDANVVLPMSLCDTLLRLAEVELSTTRSGASEFSGIWLPTA